MNKEINLYWSPDIVSTLNPEHTKALLEMINQAPFFRLLSMEVRILDPGYCRVEVDLDTKHLNPFGGLHGGVYAALIDTAAYWRYIATSTKIPA